MKPYDQLTAEEIKSLNRDQVEEYALEVGFKAIGDELATFKRAREIGLGIINRQIARLYQIPD